MWLQPGIEGDENIENTQASAHGSVRIVFVCLRIAEVDQEPVPEVLRDMAAITLDHPLARGLVGTYDLAQVFWVEPTRKGGGIHQITEHHRQLPPFSV